MATGNWTITDMQLWLKQSIHLSRRDNNGYNVIEQLTDMQLFDWNKVSISQVTITMATR